MESPLRTNPDFLDPRNPDSVQNPTGPKYGDWAGSKLTQTTRSYPHPGIPSFTPPTRTSTSYYNPTETGHPHPNVIQILEMVGQAPKPFDGYERSWYWFRQVVDGVLQDKCGKPLAEFTVDDAPDDPNLVQFPGLPPTKDFHDLEVFPGYKNCKCTGGQRMTLTVLAVSNAKVQATG
ncbi:hypothetical protein DL546_002301 [Coniochaeta pulveracea]|uniref:Uncharacterized protein n=1 Tax=Coniochaeta pulveracea TaxID=177199 RepID=A0A420Y6H9_9PEZI|nr:hypothetical protein DL546_002301 [Coniochaeta pulveracea]